MNSDLTLMMAIKPKFTDLIYQHTKSLEWRKRISKKLIQHFKAYGNRNPVKIYIYESHPTKMITGYYLADYAWDVNKNVIDHFYRAHPKSVGIELDELYAYYQISDTTPENERLGATLNIKDAIKFDKPISLWDVDISYPPQDYIYLTPYDVERIERAVSHRV